MWTERWKLKKNAALNLLSPKTPAPAFRARESFTRAALTHTLFSPELALRREPPHPALSRNHRGGNGHSASTRRTFLFFLPPTMPRSSTSSPTPPSRRPALALAALFGALACVVGPRAVAGAAQDVSRAVVCEAKRRRGRF
jgi:hypothetical protein